MSFKITKWCLPLRKKWKHRLLVCDAAPLLLLTLLLLCSSCELRCASTRTSPGCLLVLLQHLSCSCIGSACCCFCCALLVQCTLDRFTKTFFWNFQSIPADLCYILIYKQMLEKAFCSNIAPSLSSGNHLFYKAEYMGQSCPNQVWAITFDWSALAT